jgi:hypothetical protein
MTNQEYRAYRRGIDDSRRNRAPIFRSTRTFGIIPTIDDPQSEEWTVEQAKAYLEGYNYGESLR